MRGLEEWTNAHPYVRRLKELNSQPHADYQTFKKGIENPDPAIAANVMIGLIKLTNFLLDRQIHALEKAFLREGGLRERMTRARLAERERQNLNNRKSAKKLKRLQNRIIFSRDLRDSSDRRGGGCLLLGACGA